jgi:hypothetical protein
MRKSLLITVIAASAIATGLTVADAAPTGQMQPTLQSGSYQQELAQYFEPGSWNANPRLSNIEAQLDRAERTINAAKRHGSLTASEAQAAREQGKLIRNSAFDAVKQNRGSISDAAYNVLLGRVVGLNQTIQMETQRG